MTTNRAVIPFWPRLLLYGLHSSVLIPIAYFTVSSFQLKNIYEDIQLLLTVYAPLILLPSGLFLCIATHSFVLGLYRLDTDAKPKSTEAALSPEFRECCELIRLRRHTLAKNILRRIQNGDCRRFEIWETFDHPADDAELTLSALRVLGLIAHQDLSGLLDLQKYFLTSDGEAYLESIHLDIWLEWKDRTEALDATQQY